MSEWHTGGRTFGYRNDEAPRDRVMRVGGAVFGAEWEALSAAQRAAIAEDGAEVDDLAAYRQRIGVGHLASYADVLLTQAGKRLPVTSAESQTYIDTGELPEATTPSEAAWCVANDVEIHDRATRFDADGARIGETPNLVARVSWMHRPIKERRAVAAKIAAVPDLIAALKAAREHLDYTGYGDRWEREVAEAAGLEKQIAAALAKAGVQ